MQGRKEKGGPCRMACSKRPTSSKSLRAWKSCRKSLLDKKSSKGGQGIGGGGGGWLFPKSSLRQ